MTQPGPSVSLRPVDAGSWRDVAGLTIAPGQDAFVAAATHYLALCAYEDVWNPLAVHDEEGAVIGFLMWGIDDEDGSCWLGGVIVDAAHQGRGVGRAAMVQALDDPSVPATKPMGSPSRTTRRTRWRRVCTPAWGSSRRARPTTTRSSRGAVPPDPGGSGRPESPRDGARA
jgi:diamine N-acetyltransferase